MFTKMKAKKSKKTGLKEEIEIPANVSVQIKEGEITIRGEKGEITKKYPSYHIDIELKDGKIILKTKNSRRKVKALLGTTKAYIRNMIKGVTQGIEYKLKVLYSHFPISVKLQGNVLIIDNFLGRKAPIKVNVPQDVKVEIRGQEIKLSGIDKEKVGQTAANIEQATRIKKLDPRVFQDGIYIVEKDGKPILA